MKIRADKDTHMNDGKEFGSNSIKADRENRSEVGFALYSRWFKNTRISILLVTGLGLILSLVLVLGFVAYSQAGTIWSQTQGLYEHPLQVQRAISNLTLDLLEMHQVMNEILIITDDAQRENMLQSKNIVEMDAQNQMNIISNQYLGPKSDVDSVIKSYNAWLISLEETVLLVRENNNDAAQRRILPGGMNFQLMQETLSNLGTIRDFATVRGDKFYQDAKDQYDLLKSRLMILLVVIAMTSLLTSFIMVINIRGPLKELLQTSQRFQHGDYEARSRIDSRNEFGLLAASLNHQADIIHADLTNKKSIVSLTTSLLVENKLLPLSKNMLDQLIQLTGSQMGAFYILNANQDLYEQYVSIGMNSSMQTSFSATSYEGEFGKALMRGEIQHISDIPPESTVSLRTVSADLKPCEIITIPLNFGSEIPAVISLASIHKYAPTAIRFLQDVQNLLTARFNGAMTNEKVREFLERLEGQNLELQAQQREQELMTRELNEQNVELEQQKVQLSQVSQVKSTFISNMSHELRTPLNSIIALSGVLNRHLEGSIPDEEFSYLGVIERNGKNLLNLINDVLDISHLEAGKQEVNLGRFSISGLVTQLIDMIQPQANQKKIELRANVAQDLPSLVSDQSLCEHILQNLISNAVKFTDTGHVEVCARQVEENIQVDVIDTGIGIPTDLLPHIFEEFRQGDETNSRKYGGTGLGLSIAKRYTDLLKGNLQVQSVLGIGTTFRLTLPIALDPEAYDEAEINEDTWQNQSNVIMSGGDQTGKGKNILLVDDNEPALIQMTDFLTEQGYTLQVARNGQEALELMGAHLPDAIILDLMMPKMDGFEILSRLRSTEVTSSLPVLILTAKHITKEELKFLTKNNVHQLIQKGNISRKDLLDAVTRMVTPAKPLRHISPVKNDHKKSAEKLVILVVEDNPDNMLAARALLKDAYYLVEAWDGQAGVEQARLHKPDLILMDISLPVMDGIQALKTLRADQELAAIPVVALTASAMKGSREEILEYGFDAYVAKPIDPGILTDTIQEVLFGE